MAMPDFFEHAPRIVMHDPLAETLGASDDGLIEYSFSDAVRVAGHACPTVAGAWLMVRAGLRALYADQTAVRGNLEVAMRGAESEGVTGVIAQIFTLITGAAADNGFAGLAGRFRRRDLLTYGQTEVRGTARLRRLDTGAAVHLDTRLAGVPGDPQMQRLMSAALSVDATAEQRRTFANAWQERVRRLLLEHADDPQVILVEPDLPAEN